MPFNGTATRFTLSNPPLTAQQLLVGINGVIQEPNAGTSLRRICNKWWT